MKTYPSFSISRLLLLVAFLFPLTALQAQTNLTTDDEEEEEEGDTWTTQPEKAPIEKFDEALILLNGKEFKIQPEMSIERNDTVEIGVRHLKPLSRVGVVVRKGSVVVKKTAFYANELGELDLEVRTGGKLSGNATVDYISSSGKEIAFDVKIVVE